MNLLERIMVNPLGMSGKPCICGMRITAATVLRLLADGYTPQRTLAADPCLLYASVLVNDEELAPVPA